MNKITWKDVLGVIILSVLLVGTLEYFFPRNQPGAGNCGSGYIAKDENSPFEYNGGQNVCKVTIKAGSQEQGEACYSFRYPPANQSNGCYNVSGLGSNSVSVGGGDTGPDCKGISHVEFYSCPVPPTDTPTIPPPPTDTSTPTETEPTPTETEAPTQTPEITPTNTQDLPSPSPTPTIPWKFHTPTPRGSATPTETPGTTETPESSRTPTQYVSPTVTVSATPGSPPKRKTEAPPILPDAGGIELAEGGYGLFFAGTMLLIVFVLIFRAWIKSRK